MVIQRAPGTTQHVHLDVPLNSFTIEKRFYKVVLPVCYIDKRGVGFEDTKDLGGKRGYILIRRNLSRGRFRAYLSDICTSIVENLIGRTPRATINHSI